MIELKAFPSFITLNVDDPDYVTLYVQSGDTVALVLPCVKNDLENINVNNITAAAITNTGRVFFWNSGWFYLTWLNVKATLKTYFDAIYGALAITAPTADYTDIAVGDELQNIAEKVLGVQNYIVNYEVPADTLAVKLEGLSLVNGTYLFERISKYGVSNITGTNTVTSLQVNEIATASYQQGTIGLSTTSAGFNLAGGVLHLCIRIGS